MSDLPAAAETALLSTTISKIGGPTTTTFTQQMVPTASEYSITATAVPSTTPYATGEFTYTGDIKGCQVSNVWNWKTTDTSFIGSRWHVDSAGAFAGTCIFAILLVLLFLFLRRTAEEYEHHILSEHHRAHAFIHHPPTYEQHIAAKVHPVNCTTVRDGVLVHGIGGLPLRANPPAFRPNAVQQGARATLALSQFVVGYFVLLLIMSWNGWIFLCIGLGVWVGCFIFDWKTVMV